MNPRFNQAVSYVSIYIGSAVSVAGVQAVGPGLPMLQEHFDVTDSKTLWAISFYLFPGIICAVPLGRVADRLGRQLVFASCLMVFGIASLSIPLSGTHWPLFLGIRVIQGIAFAGIFPLSIILVAESAKGVSIMKKQGLRSVSQQTADTLYPLLGGVLATVAWYAPYLTGALTIPLAIFVFLGIEGPRVLTTTKAVARKRLNIFQSLPLVAIIFGGFIRFFIKFIPLSSLAILLVNVHGQTVVFAGIVLAISSFVGIFGALSVGFFVRHYTPFQISLVTLLLIAGAVASLAFVTHPAAIVATVSVYGFADGLFGTIQNSYVSIAVPNELRGTFSGVVGMWRNIGKFAAPLAVSVILATASLPTAFLISGIFAALSVIAIVPLRHYNKVLLDS